MAHPPAHIQEKLDAFVRETSGGAALVWVDAEGSAFFQSGVYSKNDDRLITADTPFEIGSITKVFTSLLLAESERLGKVSRLDPAAHYLLPADDPAQSALSRITLLSLATHTSGLPKLPSDFSIDADKSDPYARYNRERLIQALRRHGVALPKNPEVAYSNFGTAVLGEALAAAWNTSYADALRRHVLEPLGLRTMTFGLVGEPAHESLAPSHAAGKVVPPWTRQAFAASGALRSSTREMARFLSACLDPDPKSPLHVALDATLKCQYKVAKGKGYIGLGWHLVDNTQPPRAWHNGATAGSHGFLAIDKKRGLGLVILINSKKPPDEMGFGLLRTGPTDSHH